MLKHSQFAKKIATINSIKNVKDILHTRLMQEPHNETIKNQYKI